MVTTPGWRIDASARASLRSCSAASPASRGTLTATERCSRVSSASYTMPIPPSPSTERKTRSPMRSPMAKAPTMRSGSGTVSFCELVKGCPDKDSAASGSGRLNLVQTVPAGQLFHDGADILSATPRHHEDRVVGLHEHEVAHAQQGKAPLLSLA